MADPRAKNAAAKRIQLDSEGEEKAGVGKSAGKSQRHGRFFPDDVRADETHLSGPIAEGVNEGSW